MNNKLIKYIIAACVSFVILIGIFVLLCHSGVIVTDRSAIVGIEGMIWNGKGYSTVSGQYTEGRTIAKSADGSWDINEVKEDPSHNFVVVRSFLDQRLYVADDYIIPTSGEITKVYWNGAYIENEDFLKAMSEIDATKTTSFDYETDAIFSLTDNQHMKILYVAYENCPVATVYKGYLGKINGNWTITTLVSDDQRNEDGSPKPYTVGCYSIPDKYTDILEAFFE